MWCEASQQPNYFGWTWCSVTGSAASCFVECLFSPQWTVLIWF